MNPCALQPKIDYDHCAPAIKCRADREGASVWEVTHAGKLCRVLAHSQADADETIANEYFENPELDDQ